MGQFTDKEKLAEVDRELGFRYRVYRWQVSKGKLTKEQSDRQIQIMTEIRMDYHAKVTAAAVAHPGPLFGEQPEQLRRQTARVASLEAAQATGRTNYVPRTLAASPTTPPPKPRKI